MPRLHIRERVAPMANLTRREFLEHSIAATGAGPAVAPILPRLLRAGPVGGSVEKRATDPLTTYDPNLYLFVDDHWIAEQIGLVRVLNRPEVLPDPIIWPDDPKTQQDCAWGNVIREPDGRFRLWYCTMAMGANGLGGHEMARAGVWGRGKDFSFYPRSDADLPEVYVMLGKYAESADGVRWLKPELGLIAFRGSNKNNIVLTGERAARQFDGYLTNFDGYTILRDDQEPDPQKRYKMVAHWESVHCWDNHEVSGSLGRPQEKIDKYWATRGQFLTFSPDGLRWEQPLVRIRLPSGGGDRLLVVRDHRHARWTAYTRAGGYNAVALATSRDLMTWEPAVTELSRAQMEQHPDIESLIPFNYGNQDLGFLITQVKNPGETFLYSYLVSHHDGEPWRRITKVPDEPFIPSVAGSYYVSGSVALHNEPLIVGDKLYIYFNAFSTRPHPPHPKFGRRSIGLAVLRRDGFAGLTAARVPGGGSFTTKPIVLRNRYLYLNVEQRGRSGQVTVALQDPSGKPIPGYGFDEAVPIRADAVRQRVRWKKNADLAALHGTQLQARVRIEGGAVLYAIAFSDVCNPHWEER